MLVNLTNVFTSERQEGTYEYIFDQPELEVDMQHYPLIKGEPVMVTIKKVGVGQGTVEGNVSIVISMNCDRCLTEVEQPITFSFFHKVTTPEFRNAKEFEEDEDEEECFMEGYSLNITNLINNEILMNWPTKVLCKENCKGICKSCGQDLNNGTCTCDTFVPDPRMAGIKDIFAANKEV